MEELPEDNPWAPRMDVIRQAQLTGTAALEEVFEALGSKQHSSIIKLRKQMDAMMAWKIKVTEKQYESASRHKAAKASAATAVRREAAKAPAATTETTEESGISTPGVAAVEESADQREAPLAINVEDSDDWGASFDEALEQGKGVSCRRVKS